MNFPAMARWRQLPRDTDREDYFRVLSDAVQEYYLADPSNPFQQSGRASGEARWEETRRPMLEAVDHSGHFIDVWCANGLLLESLVGGGRENGVCRFALTGSTWSLNWSTWPGRASLPIVSRSRLRTPSIGSRSARTISSGRTWNTFHIQIGSHSCSISTAPWPLAAGSFSATIGTLTNRTSIPAWLRKAPDSPSAAESTFPAQRSPGSSDHRDGPPNIGLQPLAAGGIMSRCG